MTRASGACGRKESVLALVENQLAAAHAQNERDENEIKSLRAEVAQVKEEKGAEVESLKAEVAKLTAGLGGSSRLASLGFFLTVVMGASARARALRRTGICRGLEGFFFASLGFGSMATSLSAPGTHSEQAERLRSLFAEISRELA